MMKFARFPSELIFTQGLEHFHFHLNMDSNENVLACMLLNTLQEHCKEGV